MIISVENRLAMERRPLARLVDMDRRQTTRIQVTVARWLCCCSPGGLQNWLVFHDLGFFRSLAFDLGTSGVAARVTSSVATVTASVRLCRPSVLALRARVLVGLQNTDATGAGTVVDAVGATTTITGVT